MFPILDYRIPQQINGLRTSVSAVASSSRSTLSSAPRLAQPGCSIGCSSRSFHSSRPRLARVKGHYDALSLPRNATKQQVKARFYELSKKHHPDTPGGDKDRFHEINDAYHTLGDEKRRRVYDSSLNQSTRSSPSFGGPYSPHSPGSRPSGQGPHRAWGQRPAGRSPNEPFNPFTRPHAYPRAEPSGHHAGPGPFGRTTTGRKSTPSPEFEGLKAEGGLWRFSVVVGLLVAVVSFGGGLSVSAEELDFESAVDSRADGERIADGSQPWQPDNNRKVDA